MSIRKVILCLLVFLGGAVFGKPLALGCLGLCAKIYLLVACHAPFSYESIDWREGKLIFSDVDFQDASLQVFAERLLISPRTKHIEIDRPRVLMKSLPQWDQESGWTVEVRSGVLVTGKAGEIPFSLEKNWPRQMGKLVLSPPRLFGAAVKEQDGSKIVVEAIREGREIWIDADLDRFDVQCLRPWADLEGELSGRVHLVLGDGRCKRGSARVNIRGGGYGKVFSAVNGSLDWEGSIEPGFFLEGRGRLVFSDGRVAVQSCEIKDLAGECSFASNVGTKWEFKGLGAVQEQFLPLSWKGRAFLHKSRPGWVESEAFLGEAQWLFKGREEEGGYRFEVTARAIDSAAGTLIQSLLSLVDPRAFCGEYRQGSFDLAVQAFFPREGKAEWNAEFLTEGILCHSEYGSFRCQAASGHFSSRNLKAIFLTEKGEASDLQGEFSINDFSFDVRASDATAVSGCDWMASGRVENGVLTTSSWEGNVEEHRAAFSLSGTPQSFQMEVSTGEGSCVLQGQWGEERLTWEIEKGRFERILFQGKGWVEGRSHDWALQAQGELGSGIGFYCPLLERKGESLFFDVRLESPSWDLLRLSGVYDGSHCSIENVHTHFLGQPVQISVCDWNSGGLEKLHLHTSISSSALLTAAPYWLPAAKEWNFPMEGEGLFDLFFTAGEGFSFTLEGKNLLWKNKPLEVRCAAQQKNDVWHISSGGVNGFLFSGDVWREGAAAVAAKGRGAWKQGLEIDWEGSIDASLQTVLQIPCLRMDLGEIPLASITGPLPWGGMEGKLRGSGSVTWKKQWEADFDLLASNLKLASLSIENQGAIHLSYASDRGVLCSGLDLHVQSPDIHLKIGLLQYDALSSLWIFNHARVYLPADFLDLFPACPAMWKELKQEIDFLADLECPADFSYVSCFMKEGSLPFAGSLRSIRDLSFFLDEAKACLRLDYLHQERVVKIEAQAALGKHLSGRLMLHDFSFASKEAAEPLTIHWSYEDELGFFVREIDGCFGGIDASFRAQDQQRSLIGSARIDFGVLSEWLPPRLAQVVSDLRMGKGFELKGRLILDGGPISFCGLLCGKQIDLFGWQLRTFLGQIEFGTDRMCLRNLKISDSAGVMKIDEMLAEGSGDKPWMISIPRLTILEFRPSLLQKEGREPEPAGPLVVRELRMDDFKGLLEDSKTFSAAGELSFVNSYRRERTVFDIPSDLLGRIVGLDLELLIPVCGTIQYTLKDGFFFLTEMRNAYSEAKRSEFFLIPQPPPCMDLDGNLQILVNMKQFVLFKFTESFFISIDGKLETPKFHLQKKHRFLGL